MRSGWKRVLSLVLTMCISMSMVSANVWAAESSGDGSGSTKSIEEINEEDEVAVEEDSAPKAENDADEEESDHVPKDVKPAELEAQGIVASGECGAQGNNVTWTLDDKGTLTISGKGEMKDYQRMKTSSLPWNDSRDDITMVIIQNGVSHIGDSSFVSCDNLNTVNIANSVTSIGTYAFSLCTTLPSIIVPDSVTYIGRNAFSGCYGLTNIKIPESVTTIEDSLFYMCRGLTSVTIPDSVSSIGEHAFYGCGKLQSVTIPNTITSIKYGTFHGCRKLRSIIIPDSVVSIEKEAFAYCSGLTNVDIGQNVTRIDDQAFYCCWRLASITIPKGVSYIGDRAVGFDEVIEPSNPNLIVYIQDGFRIYGVPGSAAETYAKRQNISFVPLDGTSGSSDNETQPSSGGSDNDNQPTDELLKLIQSSDSCTYSPELAYRLMKVAYKAYEQKATVKEFLGKMGLDWYDAYNYYKEPDDPRYKEDSVAYSVGYKKTKNGKIVTVFIRGSYGNLTDLVPDWRSNLHLNASLLGAAGWHPGFDIASKEVYDQIVSLGLLDTSNTYVITGHSRGGGVGNLLAVRLSDAGVPKERVFDYNFASPDTNRGWPTDWNWSGVHDNIFNICHCEDPVGQIPGVLGNNNFGLSIGLTWGKYGRTFYYAENWSIIQAPNFDKHMQENYVQYMSKKKPLSYYKTWEEIKALNLINVTKYMQGVLSIFSCPVDVVAKDEDGNVLASVIDGQISYTDHNSGTLLAVTYDDSKWFIALGDQEVIYEVIGTDKGTMNYQSYYIDNSNDVAEDLKKCENVSLEEGKQFVASESKLFVVDENQTVITQVQEDGTETAPPEDVCIHVWSTDYIIDREPTYVEDGSESRYCVKCGQKKTGSERVITKLSKQENTISCTDTFSKTVNARKNQTFKLGASANGANLSYKPSNSKIAVDKNGKVTIPKGYVGTFTIKITSGATDKYLATKKTVTVTVNPAVTQLSSVKWDAKKKVATAAWKKNTTGKGYQLQYSTDKKFKKSVKTVKISKNKTMKATVKKLKTGTWYFRIRAVSGKNTSAWSKAKSLKIAK